ncbi:hypothetical protein LBMAG56_31370 [Verrucomicrobiota bacterium]|nr:hypothetical protein LBMAG56_31370 [Verrucomicrobiota bacterium]
MVRQPFGKALLREWVVKRLISSIAGASETRQQPGFLQRIITNHVLSRVEADQKTLQSFTRRTALSLGILVLKNQRFNGVHLLSCALATIKQVLHGLTHFLWTDAAWIQRTLSLQIATQGPKRGGKVFEFRRTIFRQFPEHPQ